MSFLETGSARHRDILLISVIKIISQPGIPIILRYRYVFLDRIGLKFVPLDRPIIALCFEGRNLIFTNNFLFVVLNPDTCRCGTLSCSVSDPDHVDSYLFSSPGSESLLGMRIRIPIQAVKMANKKG